MFALSTFVIHFTPSVESSPSFFLSLSLRIYTAVNLRYSVLFPQNPPYFVVFFFSLSIGFEGKYKADSFFQSLSGHPRQEKKKKGVKNV